MITVFISLRKLLKEGDVLRASSFRKINSFTQSEIEAVASIVLSEALNSSERYSENGDYIITCLTKLD